MTELAACSSQWMKWEHSQADVNCMNHGAVLAGESEKVLVSLVVDMANPLPAFS